MGAPRAVLLDVYDTVLTCDFDRHFRGLAEAAGVELHRWSAALEAFVPNLVLGRTTIREAFAEALSACGRPARHCDELVRRDLELITDCSTLFPDVVPAIRRRQSRDVRVALISNCVANTRPLLDSLGLLGVVDAAILSCEVGSAKPDASIYREAAIAVDVDLHTAMLIDDHEIYCAGAKSTGMRAILINRTATAIPAHPQRRTIQNLADAEFAWAG